MGKILVAEDSHIVNQHICHTLSTSGHNTVSSFTGKDAIALANKEKPDLILMDIMMETSSDGLDAAMAIKQTLDIPIIFLTALTDEPTIQKAKISLPFGYVVKPFNEAELLSNIDVALYKAQAERSIKENSELFQNIFNSIDEAIILTDSELKIKYTNDVAEKFSGKPFNRLVNKPIDETFKFIDENGQITFDQFFELNLSNLELKLSGKDAIYGDFQLTKVQLEDDAYLFIFKDVTYTVESRKEREALKNRRISALIEGQEKERERIARDLHDGVGQIANMVKLTAKKYDQSNELVDMIDLFLDEMRKVTEGLLPSRLNDFPLPVCINRIVEQAEDNSDIFFSFSHQDVPELEMKLKVNLYRIVQENLSNILKHSKATTATIQLYGFEDYIQLSIEDDGIGFDISNYKNNEVHHGLQNILFRAEVLNAECDIESKPGEGTFLNMTIPK